MTRGFDRLVLSDPFLLMILDDYWFLEAKFLTTHWAEWLAFFETLSSSIWKKGTKQLPNPPYQKKGDRVFDTMAHKIAALSASDARVVKSEEPQRTLHCFGFIEKNQLRDIPISDFWSDKFLVAKNTSTHKKRIICKRRNEWPSILGKPFKWHFCWGIQYLKILKFGLSAKIG